MFRRVYAKVPPGDNHDSGGMVPAATLPDLWDGGKAFVGRSGSNSHDTSVSVVSCQ